MSETHPNLLIVFLLQIGVMLAVGLAFGQLLRRMHQPAVLGELIGGIVLGPTIFGFLFPDLFQRLFPADAQITEVRDTIISVGMLFFMFIAGLEVDLSQLQRRKQSILLISILGCLIPFVLAVVSVVSFPTFWQSASIEQDTNFVLFMGIALSISALPVITRILMDLRLLQEEWGGIVITSAAINDLLGWALFAFLLSSFSVNSTGGNLLQTFGTVFLFSVLILVFGRTVGGSLLRWVRNSLVWPGSFLAVCAVFIFLAAAVAEMLHIHAIFGAFLIGVALFPVFAQNEADHAKEIVHQFAVSLYAPLYFVSVGLKADFAANFDLPLVLLVIVLATLGKVVGAGLGARLSGSHLREALAIGVAMNARGAMEMILASVALEHGLIDQRIFVALVTMALVTSMMSGPLLQRLLQMPPAPVVSPLSQERGDSI